MIPLTACPLGQTATVVRIAADDKLRHRLESMGAVRGATLEVFSETDGNLLLKMAGAKVGLNRELAMRVFVAPVKD